MDIRPYLDDLESRINPDVEADLLEQWQHFCRGECADDVFVPRRKAPAPAPRLAWPAISINESLRDPAKMVVHQLAACSAQIAAGSGYLLNVRSNYGVSILARPFGCELFMMSDESQTLPNCYPVGPDAVRAWLDRDMPQLTHPSLQEVFKVGERFAEISRNYPKIGQFVSIYHPDLQGPLDILELIWGSDVFLAFIDEPETIHRALRMITELYLAVMRRWRQIVPVRDPAWSAHWGLMQPGQIMIRLDSAMNLPPDFINEFSRPYDQQLLDALGGGALHACGRVDHWIDLLPQIRGAMAMNISQPHLNDMEKVLAHTVDRGLLLLDLRPDAVAQLQAAKRPLRGRVQCFS